MFLGNSRVSKQIIYPQTHVSPLEQGFNTLEMEWDQPRLFGVSFLLLCVLEWGGGPSVLMKLWSTTRARGGARVPRALAPARTSAHQCGRVALTLNKPS